MKITTENYVEELLKIHTAVAELYHFHKQHPIKSFCLGRCNGKTRFAYIFLKYYGSIIEAYSRAEKKIAQPTIFHRLKKKLFTIRLRIRLRFREKKIKKLTRDGYAPNITEIDEMHSVGVDQNYEQTIQATPGEREVYKK